MLKKYNLKFKQFIEKSSKMRDFENLESPKVGWINYFRTCLNMTQLQLARKLRISQPAAKSLEKSEQQFGITLESLRKVADAFDCDLKYAFVPRRGMDTFVEEAAYKYAEKEFDYVQHSMTLENQELTEKNRKEEIESIAEDLIKNVSKKIWD